MSILMLVLSGLLTLATGVIVVVAVRLVRALRHTVELEQRVARLQEGVNLLTDTAETGFRQVATEIERLSASGAMPATVTTASRPTAVRLRAASHRGRSVKDIAAEEQISEGEVRLRLSLANAGAAGRPRATSGKAKTKAKANALRA